MNYEIKNKNLRKYLGCEIVKVNMTHYYFNNIFGVTESDIQFFKNIEKRLYNCVKCKALHSK